MIEEQLCRMFCSGVSVRKVMAGRAVSLPFLGRGGDRVGMFIVRNAAEADSFDIRDNGTVFPALEASGFDIGTKSRQLALDGIMKDYGVTLDPDDRFFCISGLEEKDLAAAALKFAAFCLRVDDLFFLIEKRVANTFRQDVERRIREMVAKWGEVFVSEPLSPRLAEFAPDFTIRPLQSRAIGIYLGTSDARVLEALYIKMKMLHETNEDYIISAVIENVNSVTERVRQQAMNRLHSVTPFRGDEVQAIHHALGPEFETRKPVRYDA